MSDNQITVTTEVSQAQVTISASPVTVNETVHLVTVTENTQQVSVEYGSPGAEGTPGPPGVDGVGISATVTAGETIPGHRAIAIVGNQAFLADPTNLTHGLSTIGIVRDAISVGGMGTYYLIGEINGGSFTADTDLFIGVNGTLSDSPIALGAVWMKRVGTAKNSSVLVIEMDPTILL